MTPGNYLTQALTHFRAAGDADLKAREILDQAASAPKFFLPDDGMLLSRDLLHLDVDARLPYPTVCLEFATREQNDFWRYEPGQVELEPWIEEELGLVGTAYATDRRIVVAREHEKEGRHFIRVSSLSRQVETSGLRPATWRADTGLNWHPRMISKKNPFLLSIYVAVAPVFSLIQALQCANVQAELAITAKPKVNERRIADGKAPFFDYHILTLKDLPQRRHREPTENGHASPRQHLRRGHIRRLDDGRRLWINATVVGAAENGTISKDYRMLGA
jgi:hypothetical protein